MHDAIPDRCPMGPEGGSPGSGCAIPPDLRPSKNYSQFFFPPRGPKPGA